MHIPGIPVQIAHAILAANQTVATATDPLRIPRLEFDDEGQLRVLKLPMNGGNGFGPHPDDFDRPAAGYTVIAAVHTWHPAYAGRFPRHTVAEVVAQLPPGLRDQVTAVQFLDYAVADTQHPVGPTAANHYLKGWLLMLTRLYGRESAAEDLGMRILSERVDREYPNDKRVKVFDLELLPTGEVWTDEPLWSVPPAAAGLLISNDRQTIGVVRQGRIGVGGRKLTEPIAGGVDDGEQPLAAFAREAEEETGLRPADVTRVARVVVSAGRTDEVKTLAIGTGLVPGTRTEGAEIETIWFPISQLDLMIETAADGGDQTLWGLLLWLWRDIARNAPDLLSRAR